MADRIAVLRGGKLEAYGTPSELYQRPQTRFVAAFIGHPPMNLLPATLAHTDGSLHIKVAGVDLALPAPLASQLNGNASAGREVLLGVRPEDIFPAADGQLAGEVDLVEPLGREDLIMVRRGTTQINALAPTGSRFDAGSPVHLRVNTERIHLFDPATDTSLLRH